MVLVPPGHRDVLNSTRFASQKCLESKHFFHQEGWLVGWLVSTGGWEKKWALKQEEKKKKNSQRRLKEGLNLFLLRWCLVVWDLFLQDTICWERRICWERNGKDWALGCPGMEVLFHLLINGVSWAYNPLTNIFWCASLVLLVDRGCTCHQTGKIRFMDFQRAWNQDFHHFRCFRNPKKKLPP